MKIWIVQFRSEGQGMLIESAWMDRDDAFKSYAAVIAKRFSTNAVTIAANDYNPGKNLEYSDRYSDDCVCLTNLDVNEKGK